jgi:hypothetical protein
MKPTTCTVLLHTNFYGATSTCRIKTSVIGFSSWHRKKSTVRPPSPRFILCVAGLHLFFGLVSIARVPALGPCDKSCARDTSDKCHDVAAALLERSTRSQLLTQPDNTRQCRLSYFSRNHAGQKSNMRQEVTFFSC